MGYRLSNIATRTGDGGTTGLADGSRLPKDAPRIAALGDVDELNAVMGMLACEPMPEPLREPLLRIQNDLFDLGGELAMPGHPALTDEHVRFLDGQLEALNRDLPPLRDFILPGGSRGAALAHLARTVCRRAERTVITLERIEALPPQVRMYLNRLSDLMFVMSRSLNRTAGVSDRLWQPRVKPGP
jgi:cob(I)alamin adenosyltransferase